jgi:hypothetical protein
MNAVPQAIVVRLFVSHSFSDEHHLLGVAAFRKTVDSACRLAEVACENRGFRAEIRPYFEDPSIGEPLPRQIRSHIARCDVLLADLSGRTANTLYELGFAHALKKRLVVWQTQEVKFEPLPSDLTDVLIGVYTSNETLEAGVSQRLAELALAICSEERASTRRRMSRSFWFEENVREIHVVCGPEPEKTRFASSDADDYLFVDNFDDRDALFDVTAYLSRAYPNAKILRHTSSNVPSDVWESNLVLLGGPLTNDVTKDMMAELAVRCRYIDDDLAISFASSPSSADGSIVRAKKDTAGKLVEDAGYFGWFRNPFLRDHRIIMCQGCHTFGTLAAYHFLSDSHQALENIKTIEAATGAEIALLERVECSFIVRILKNRKILPPELNSELMYTE